MRTSRVARDTARVVNALSPRKRYTRDLHDLSKNIPTAAVRKTAKHDDDGSDTSLSSAPSDLEDETTTITASATVISRKRKRGIQLPAINVTTLSEESILSKRSPRKAGVTSNGKPKKARRQPAVQVKDQNGDVRIQPPPDWEEVYKLTKEMREKVPAPVDTMGCESLAEDTRSPRDRRFQTLIALMLSSQTKDTVTAVAMKNLQDNLLGGFTLESILSVPPTDLNTLIAKVGFHNNKTKYIKATAEILRDCHASDIPDTIEGLIALPGVGPKMAYLCMSAAWGRDEGIGVDVHVHRITNLWGWHRTNTPEETRAALESWLPRDKWHDINHLLVGFGQTWCPPVGRKCGECLLAERGLCPSAVVGKVVKKKIKRETVIIKDKHGGDGTSVKVEQVVVKAVDLNSEDDAAIHTVRDIEDIGAYPKRSRRLVSL